MAAGDDFEYIKSQIENGKMELVLIGQCHFVLKTEYSGNDKELVIVCSGGKNIRKAFATMRVQAKKKGFKTIVLFVSNCVNYLL